MPDLVVTGTIRDKTDTAQQFTMGLANVTVTTTGIHEDRRTIEVPTSEIVVTLSADIVTKGLITIENRDSTNYVEFGYATGVYPERILPGRPSVRTLSPSQATFVLKANGAACDVRFHALEE